MDAAEERFKVFSGKLDALKKAYEQNTAALKENTLQTKKLLRTLQAQGYRDPADLDRAMKTGLAAPEPQGRRDPFVMATEHILKAFPPEDLQEMARDLFDGLTKPRRRR